MKKFRAVVERASESTGGSAGPIVGWRIAVWPFTLLAYLPRYALTSLLLFPAFEISADDFLVPLGSEWRYSASAQSSRNEWLEAEFDDSSWASGRSGFGYGDNDDATTLDMRGKFTVLHIRRSFDISTIPVRLYLHARYDDAFEAYVNGELVARFGFEGNRVASHEAVTVEVFSIPTNPLKIGQNILAVRGFNVDSDSSDFSLDIGLSPSLSSLDEIGRESAVRDLNLLKERLFLQSSYLHLRDPEPIAALDALAESLPRRMLRRDFLRQIQIVLALIGDAHASASAEFQNEGAKYLPLSLADAEKGILAIEADSERLVLPSYPYIAGIDGLTVDAWIEKASHAVAKASPQLNRRRAIRSIHRVDLLRTELQLMASDTVLVSFRNDNGQLYHLESPLVEGRPTTVEVPLADSRTLSNSIGYMVIRSMDEDLVDDLLEQMVKYRNTRALIIDVRYNGGGSYHILRALAPYFVPESSDPFVGNVMAYRLAPFFRSDHLAYRPTFRVDDPEWTTEEKDVIQHAMTRFQPVWKLPEGQFSAWHVMLLNRDRDRSRRTYFYDRPVVVLMNEWCFSATDVFLSVFAEFPQATLIGQASGGGSGAKRRFLLPESDIEITVSSAASFRTNGLLYDGYGIEVDIPVSPRSNDFLGRSDRVLDRAIEFLEQEIRQ